MRLRIGNKPGVGPILKVMKYDADDPFTTSSMDFDRFFFDSESQNLSYMYDFKSYGVMNKSVYPTGSYSVDGKPLNQTQWGLRSNYGPTQSYDYFYPMAFLGRMTDLPYPPMVDARHIGSDGWVRAMSGYYPNSTGGPRAWTVMNSCVVANVQSGRTGVPEYRNIHNDYSYTGWCGRADSQGSTYSTITNPGENVTFAVWDLPSGEEEEPSPPLPVLGQKIITMSNARFAIAKPGYDVRTAQKRNLIMDSDKSPIKCIMYGETPMVYSGQTYFVPKTVDFDLDPTMHLEFFLKTQDSSQFQIPPTSYATPGESSRSVQFYYRIDPDGIRFRAAGAYGHAVKFVLFATGPAPFTTGGSRVVGKLPAGGFRIKRPGSSDVAPNYNDIMLDTRLPTAYVVANEWVSLSRFSGGDTRQFDIPIPDKDMFYYLKVMADFGDVRRHANYYVNVRLQYVNGWGNVAIYETSRQTFIVQDHGTFYRCLLYPNAPGDTNLSGPRGIRYHLLGITNRN